ncbi:MAG: peptidylprolyl isomerase [Nitrospiraceae bacterium]|nr:peptidylprolyl isomerase [Nitrospiraceae bacterium]
MTSGRIIPENGNRATGRPSAVRIGLVLASAAILLVFLHVSSAKAGDGNGPEKPVARVNGKVLTEKKLEEMIDAMLPKAIYHSTVTPEKRAEFRPKALEELIKTELYFQEAKRTGVAVKSADVDEAVDRLRKRFKTEADFSKALASSGYTLDTLKDGIERNLIVTKFMEGEIIDKAKVSEQEVKENYEKNKKDHMRPESAKLLHILISVDPAATAEEKEAKRKEAADILARAKAGEDFEDLAYKHSNDAWSVKGGDLGLVHKGRLDPELEKAAFQCETGQICGLIETLYGFHIVKVVEKNPPVQLTYDEVKDKLRKQLEEKRIKEREADLLKRLKENAKIEVY